MYTLVKKRNKFKSDTIIELIGYETRISRELVTIYDQRIIDIIIKNKFCPEFNRLVKKILIFIEEDGNPDDAALLLGELERLHAVFLNKYEKFLSKSEKISYMKTLRIISNELKQLTYKKHKTIIEHRTRRK